MEIIHLITNTELQFVIDTHIYIGGKELKSNDIYIFIPFLLILLS